MLSASKSSSNKKLLPLLCISVGFLTSSSFASMEKAVRRASCVDSISSDSGLMYVLFIFYIFVFEALPHVGRVWVGSLLLNEFLAILDNDSLEVLVYANAVEVVD